MDQVCSTGIDQVCSTGIDQALSRYDVADVTFGSLVTYHHICINKPFCEYGLTA